MELLAGIPPIHRYLALIVRQALSRPTLERRPEPRVVTDQLENVLQYDQVMSTRLAIAYAVGINAIYRARRKPFGGSAIDLACGPGHFSCCMAECLKLDQLIGVDLSPHMIEAANANAAKNAKRDLQFRVADITHLQPFSDDEFVLCTLTDATHHLPDLETAKNVVREMDRITAPSGLVFVMDLARLKTEGITNAYVNLVGRDYAKMGLNEFFLDFQNSMFAAWSVDEFVDIAPPSDKRRWFALKPRLLPTLQMLIGVPREQRRLFHNGNYRWSPDAHIVPARLRREWRLMASTITCGKVQALRM